MEAHNASKSPAATQTPAGQPRAPSRTPSPSNRDFPQLPDLGSQTSNLFADKLTGTDSNHSGEGLPHNRGAPLSPPQICPPPAAGIAPEPHARQRSRSSYQEEADPPAGVQTGHLQQGPTHSEAR